MWARRPFRHWLYWIAVCISSLDNPLLKFSKYHLWMHIQGRHSDTLCILSGAGKVWKMEVSSCCSTIRAVYHNCGLVWWLLPARHAQFQRGSTKYCLEIWHKELISQKLAWENHVSARVCVPLGSRGHPKDGVRAWHKSCANEGDEIGSSHRR